LRFLPFNNSALLVELPDLEHTLALLHSLQTDPIAGVTELVPAARTILLRFAPQRIARARLQTTIAERKINASAALPERGTAIEIPVRYDGEDLAEVAHTLGLSTQEVIARHTASTWFAAFTGFSPGFAYLAGGDPIFQVPRRATPRTHVPAGAVALAGQFSAVYPRASPGGWQLIGTAQVAMWDVTRTPPALLAAGQPLRFVDVTDKPVAVSDTQSPAAPPRLESDSASALLVQRPGLLTTLQDLGRPGLQAQGVTASGAMDQAALRAANRLVGNTSNAGSLETLGAGLSLQSQGDTVVAVTGADVTITLSTSGGRRWRVPTYQALALADGDSLTVDACLAGLRAYIAVRGGFAVAPVLGSVASDTLSQLGPAPLTTGTVLGVSALHHYPAVSLSEVPPAPLPRTGTEVVLDIWIGPRADWFTTSSQQLLTSQRWQVTPQSNRVGLRLAGNLPLTRTTVTQDTELPSEGLVCGAIQIPPSGQPILFLRDHSTTGGYPVIACVADHHLDLAGQIPPGAYIRFNLIA